jgi:hypothetical protein
MGSCKETNVPTVNDAAIECHELTPTNCVVLSEAVACLQTGKGQTLTQLLTRLCSNLTAIQNRLTTVENELAEANQTILELTQRIENVENTCCG